MKSKCCGVDFICHEGLGGSDINICKRCLEHCELVNDNYEFGKKPKMRLEIPSSLPILLFLIFLVLKLTKAITWSWLWVTAPLWITTLFMMAILFFIIIVAAFSGELR